MTRAQSSCPWRSLLFRCICACCMICGGSSASMNAVEQLKQLHPARLQVTLDQLEGYELMSGDVAAIQRISKAVSPYHHWDGDADLEGQHRKMVDRDYRWHVVGRQQLVFLKLRGMGRSSRLLDIGCGCLRGGVNFVRYLNPGLYYGMDLNDNLLRLGYEKEIMALGLTPKLPRGNLLASDSCEASKFGVKFDFMFSYSLWSHMVLGEIDTCLDNVMLGLAPHGKYYTTFFHAPEGEQFRPISRGIIGGKSYPNKDPFHHTFASIENVALSKGLVLRSLGFFGPDNQTMLEIKFG
eukprot:TRINITY_DN56674_c0_g1_i1.p1 TRINITY_DN56674_c0_g1~~TRINITY_DN56674_c0_g1_i1.p1  ORF type:complete len:295 (-),score=36.79 TRINITY_DN56674_c0_g1_i1:330-1214(-)